MVQVEEGSGENTGMWAGKSRAEEMFVGWLVA